MDMTVSNPDWQQLPTLVSNKDEGRRLVLSEVEMMKDETKPLLHPSSFIL